jgi:hypothetical protein
MHKIARNAYKILVGKLEGEKPLGHRWEDNIKLVLKGDSVGMWIGFVWFRIGNSRGSSEHGNELPDRIKGG